MVAGNDSVKRHSVDREALPALFPTNRHEPAFWEALGRTVAALGFLEETLGKAIFAFTGTKSFTSSREAQVAFEKWLPTLERALYEALGGLVDTYGRAVRDHGGATITNLSDLLDDLRAAAAVRNVLCHGSWRLPDEQGRSVPLYVTRRMEIFATPIDITFLNQTREHVMELACSVIDTITHMGWQFPGSSGPGQPLHASTAS